MVISCFAAGLAFPSHRSACLPKTFLFYGKLLKRICLIVAKNVWQIGLTNVFYTSMYLRQVEQSDRNSMFLITWSVPKPFVFEQKIKCVKASL